MPRLVGRSERSILGLNIPNLRLLRADTGPRTPALLGLLEASLMTRVQTFMRTRGSLGHHLLEKG